MYPSQTKTSLSTTTENESDVLNDAECLGVERSSHLLGASLSVSMVAAAADKPHLAGCGYCSTALPSLLPLLLLLLLLLLFAEPGGSCWWICWGAGVAAHVRGVLMPMNVTGLSAVCTYPRQA